MHTHMCMVRKEGISYIAYAYPNACYAVKTGIQAILLPQPLK